MPVLTAKPNYAAWRIPLYSRDELHRWPPAEQLIFLCSLAHLAPSTHNTQPWRFLCDITHQCVDIYLDKKAVLPASDIIGRQAVISIGCAIENLISAGKYYGFSANVRFLDPDPAIIKPTTKGNAERHRYVPIARIALTPSETTDLSGETIRCITQRKVVRAEFDPLKTLPPDLIDLIAAIPDGEITKLHIVTDAARRLIISEFQHQADSFVINSPKFSRELGEWLLPNDTTSFVGMPGIGFGLQDDQAVRLHLGLLGKTPLQPEDGLRFAMAGKIGLEKSPLLGFITIQKDTVENWLAAGRTFEKIFLSMVTRSVQVSVHAGIVEVPLVKTMFSVTMGTLRPITVLFRAGYVKKEADARRPPSPRLPIAEVMLNDIP